MTQNPLTWGKKHLKSTVPFSQFTFLSHLFHASTRTKGSFIDFSLHLGKRVSPTQGHALLDEVNTFNCGIFATFVRLPVVVNSAARLGAMAFGKANSGEKWRETFWCSLTFEPPQVVEPLVTIHLYQVSSTDEITQVKNKIMIASLIDAGVWFSGPSLWSWVSSDRVFASLYRLYLCQWTGTFCSFAVAGRNQFHMRRLAS